MIGRGLVPGEVNDALWLAARDGSDALVRVRSRWGGGSGIVWDSCGLVVTNAHVVGRGPVEIDLPDGRLLEGHSITVDSKRDVAIVAVDADDLVAARTGNARDLRAGELVFAHGYPWGLRPTVNAGVVIGMGRDWPGLVGGPTQSDWLVVSMRLRPGNSGGPVFDSAGRLVGIATAIAGPDIGMAVPTYVAEELVSELRYTLPV